MSEEQFENVIELKHITKVFPGIKANDDISLTLRKGEIHALLGENGAGKSTLMSVLFGLYQQDGGEIYVRGEKVKIKNPNDATRYGIGMVHQHFKLVGCYTALQNIILGYEPVTKAFGFLKPKSVRQSLIDLCEKFHFKVDLDKKIDVMPVGEQQKVEILKMLYRNNDILIFDEPTAVLTPQEIEELMQSMKQLVSEGKSILFISHKLNEIMEVSDRVTVLRKGRCLGTLNTKDTDVNELSRLMVGRDVKLVTDKKPSTPGKPILEVNNLVVHDKEKKKDLIKNISFKVRQGEVVCVAGIEGNGQTDLVYALTGLSKIKSGEAILHDVPIANYMPKDVKKKIKAEKKIIKQCKKDGTEIPPSEVPQTIDVHLEKLSIREKSTCGISHIPEDRQKYGLALDFNLKDNLVLQRYFAKEFQAGGFIKERAKEEYAYRLIEQYDIRSSLGPKTTVRSMSGGNQQKAIIARELDRDSSLLIAVQPTRGLDVGAIEYIHKQIIKHRDENAAVLLVSLELDEVMNLSDRILVMYNGEIVGEFDPKKTNVNELGLYMSGAKRMTKEEIQQIEEAM
ncbi:MAG: ABC transporter ATP-binding protein [Candidatus Enterosoma sp.]|nr:ABC transporter ATP-binding protein [Bacilli bacterium]MCI6608017.1 ABC transporter ATP-binding protein [Bacilli bacterium]MDD7572096.1 ABC transporter ATP-binding protein [bacterium]MDY5970168.1 ABC transporter ATP-binding protein [Candidatus Enterosoma sp.]MDY6064505.1 ABC transporter ATP-binding protein [Candidatus Enterosoma sp.]